jgi:hypothetical protein
VAPPEAGLTSSFRARYRAQHRVMAASVRVTSARGSGGSITDSSTASEGCSGDPRDDLAIYVGIFVQ